MSLFPLLFLLLQMTTGDVQEVYQRGKFSFERGEFSQAIEIIQPLLYPEIKLQSQQQTVDARKLLGISYLFEKRNAEARSEFIKLLQIQPDYHLDPRLEPPAVVDFFNSVRHEQEDKLAALEKQRKIAEKRNKDECTRLIVEPVVVERRIRQNAYWKNFVPFGAGQFQNGQKKKGYFFAVSEASFLAISVGAYLTKYWIFGTSPTRSCQYDLATACPPDLIDNKAEQRAHRYTNIQVTSGLLFFAIYGYGILDALYHYKPETFWAFSPASMHGPKTRNLVPTAVGDTIGPGIYFHF